MTRTVHLTLRARKQIRSAAAWWLENRDKAPEAFEDDLEQMLGRISTSPGIGVPVPARRRGIRRVFLERLHYFLYYHVRSDGDIDVVALWHASRGSRPRL